MKTVETSKMAGIKIIYAWDLGGVGGTKMYRASIMGLQIPGLSRRPQDFHGLTKIGLGRIQNRLSWARAPVVHRCIAKQKSSCITRETVISVSYFQQNICGWTHIFAHGNCCVFGLGLWRGGEFSVGSTFSEIYDQLQEDPIRFSLDSP